MPAISSDTSGKRAQNKAKNRAAILEAAREVFIEIGYDAATVRDIVARTRLAPGTFYNYFPDKHSVLLALVNEASTFGAQRIREARARATCFEELVHLGFRAYFELIAGNPTLFALVRRNLPTLRGLGMQESGFAAGLDELRADLESATAEGRFPPVPLTYLPQVVGAIAFEVGAEMVQHDPPDVEEATRFATGLCIGGIQHLLKSTASSP